MDKVEELLLKLRGLKLGDRVLIRTQNYYGKHKIVEAEVVEIGKDYYSFYSLNLPSDVPSYFRVKKNKIEKRIKGVKFHEGSNKRN